METDWEEYERRREVIKRAEAALESVGAQLIPLVTPIVAEFLKKGEYPMTYNSGMEEYGNRAAFDQWFANQGGSLLYSAKVHQAAVDEYKEYEERKGKRVQDQPPAPDLFEWTLQKYAKRQARLLAEAWRRCIENIPDSFHSPYGPETLGDDWLPREVNDARIASALKGDGNFLEPSEARAILRQIGVLPPKLIECLALSYGTSSLWSQLLPNT